MTSPFPTIVKPSPDQMAVKPNLDYDKVRANFSWDDMFKEMDWLPGGWLNMAHEAIDRHAHGRLRDKLAMIWEGKNGEQETYTFGQLKTLTDKFANVVKSLGVEKGDRVFILMDRIPELYVALFGTLKVGAIAGPLSSAFGPDPVKDRLQDSGAKLLITQPDLRRRVIGIIPELFDLQHIIVVNKNDRDPIPLDVSDLGYEEEMSKASANYDIAITSQYDYSIMHYTSGTTGKPKGAVHRHQAAVQHYATGKWALDLHDDDIYWCTADSGWVTGTSYGMMAPWTNGVTQLIYEGGFGGQRLVPADTEAQGNRLVHRPSRHTHDDEGGGRPAQEVRSVEPALHMQRRRAAEPRGGDLGREGPWEAVPRQLAADRDRSHTGGQLPGHGHKPGLSGPSHPWHRDRHTR